MRYFFYYHSLSLFFARGGERRSGILNLYPPLFSTFFYKIKLYIKTFIKFFLCKHRVRCMCTCERTCDVQRVCKKKCEALLHATSCMHARTRVRCNELHEFSESANSDTTGGYPPGGVRFRTFCKTQNPSAGRIPPPPPPPPFSDSTTPNSHFPPPKHTFAQLFYVFAQLFYVFDNFLTKFLKIFTF